MSRPHPQNLIDIPSTASEALLDPLGRPTMLPTVYLAGPTVFLPDALEQFAWMKAICAQHGLVGMAPLDAQMALEGHIPGPALANAIVEADIGLMHTAVAGIFCLDGFRRGPEMDAGTAFEVGYMHALGRPLVGWTTDPRLYPERVRSYVEDRFGQPCVATTTLASGATSGGWRDPDGVLIHSEGCMQNSMVHVSIERSGGQIFADPDPKRAFAQAIVCLAKRLLDPKG